MRASCATGTTSCKTAPAPTSPTSLTALWQMAQSAPSARSGTRQQRAVMGARHTQSGGSFCSPFSSGCGSSFCWSELLLNTGHDEAKSVEDARTAVHPSKLSTKVYSTSFSCPIVGFEATNDNTETRITTGCCCVSPYGRDNHGDVDQCVPQPKTARSTRAGGGAPRVCVRRAAAGCGGSPHACRRIAPLPAALLLRF